MGGTPILSFLLPGVGSGEWLVILAVALLVVGPRRLPEIARRIGRAIETLRRAADEFRGQIERMDEPSPRPPAAPPGTPPVDPPPGESAP